MKSRHCRDIVASDPFSFLALTMENVLRFHFCGFFNLMSCGEFISGKLCSFF